MSHIKIHNVETGEIIEREMTLEELNKWESDKLKYQETLNKELEALELKKSLLDKLGITEEEAKLLLS